MRLPLALGLVALLACGCATSPEKLHARVHGADLVREARRQVGRPYRYGGDSPGEGFDCSGLVFYCFKQLGMRVPRTTSKLFHLGHRVPKGHLLPGDLIFFDASGPGPSHVGIYSGGDRMIHAPQTGERVREENIGARYWLRHFVGACRVD